MLTIEPTGQACGAFVTGVDLTAPVDAETIRAIRGAWLEHHVLAFPDQVMSEADLERFAEYFGPIGDDPYFEPIHPSSRIAAIQRAADETSPLFAEVWHTDWSFMAVPPSGTCLYGITIPPVGGDTHFTNQHKAFDDMPAEMRARFEGLLGVHSARRAYADDGRYNKETYNGTMAIRTSDDAFARQTHPLIRPHPETGRPGIFGGSYVLDIDGMEDDAAGELIQELKDWLARPAFHYHHRWAANMLVLWDNRSVLHKATGGYEGHARLLHRLTIADDPAYHADAAAA